MRLLPTHLITTGLGTEQLEESLSARFPQFKVTRIDRDSTARKGSLNNISRIFAKAKAKF